MKNFNTKGGMSILGILILAAIIILALSYFGISIRGIVESPSGQENLSFIRGEIKSLWNDYLAKPASYIWNDVVVNIFWKSFIYNMERIRDGLPTDFDKAADNLKIKQ